MSLINKMLQDLDARGSAGAGALQMDIKPVLREERRLPRPLALGLLAGAGAVVIAVGAAVGWRYLHRPPASAAAAPRPAVVVLRPAPQVLPAAHPVPAPVANTPLDSVSAQPKQEPAPAEAAAVTAPVPAPKLRPDPAPALRSAVPPASVPAPAAARSVKPEKVQAQPRPLAKTVPEQAAPAPVPPAAEGAQASGARRGEDAYRRALASLQDGRVTETIASLEQALQLEPRHDAARQTLIGLLVESGRVDEAMRQLQQALALDARQPALAMLLARLQIERGGSGIETLTRSLPYAAGTGEYQAFLAGALQRQGRHAEAAEQYQAALRKAPANAVWWMGLGISLQADKRDADAQAAFRRAQAAGTLTPELQAFVERKLQQPRR